MRLSQSFTRSLALSCLAIVIVAGAALAEKFEPRVGQPGKDVVWVPSPQALVDRMLDIAKLDAGRLPHGPRLGRRPHRHHRGEARRDRRRRRIQSEHGRSGARERQGRPASPIARPSSRATCSRPTSPRRPSSRCSCCPTSICGCVRRFSTCSPGTRIVSNSFDMGDWTPDQTIQAGPECTSWCRAHLWIVPAKVQGTWKLPDGGELTLEQKYQVITGYAADRRQQHEHHHRQGDRRPDHLHRRQRCSTPAA